MVGIKNIYSKSIYFFAKRKDKLVNDKGIQNWLTMLVNKFQNNKSKQSG